MNTYILILLFFITSIGNSIAVVQDSIGIERKEDKLYILHRVEAKETLYSIAKKYGSNLEDIKRDNPTAITNLYVGQVIKVLTKEKTNTTLSASSGSGTVHIVKSGETLYSIATSYNVSVDDIKKSNPGISSSLKVGQKLTIPTKATTSVPSPTAVATTTKMVEHKVTSGQTLYSISRQYNVSVEEIKKVNPGMSSALIVGQIIKVPTTVTTTIPSNTPTKPTTTTVVEPITAVTPTAVTKDQQDSLRLVQERTKLNEIKEVQTPVTPTKPTSSPDFKKITEAGTADVMTDNQESPKYLAYHKTAPVGTIIQVINESNGQKIYVRVVGKLTTTDTKSIISLSKKAYERLGGTGTKLNVSLMYIP
ncbi:MAG: LysM peptidoglycan-binding domain-containing protein [Cytophagaceae bacterium]|jgi:LysM repeat protein|nr:LysM peptidoglycan-binding domain-containing protein [Cytophagaceae bacterium]